MFSYKFPLKENSAFGKICRYYWDREMFSHLKNIINELDISAIHKKLLLLLLIDRKSIKEIAGLDIDLAQENIYRLKTAAIKSANESVIQDYINKVNSITKDL